MIQTTLVQLLTDEPEAAASLAYECESMAPRPNPAELRFEPDHRWIVARLDGTMVGVWFRDERMWDWGSARWSEVAG